MHLVVRASAAAVLTAAILLLAAPAGAASISYFLDQTNDAEGWLPDGTQDYVKVTIADSTTVIGDIDFTVEILPPLLVIQQPSGFGVANFLFNSTNVLSAAEIIGEPASWSVSTDYSAGPPHLTGNGFGRFEIRLSAAGDETRQSPTLSFSISTAGDSIGDYVAPATNGSQGTTFFAVQVAGFMDQDPEDPLDEIDVGNPGIGECYDTDGMGSYTPGCNILNSLWVGGTNEVAAPEPSALLLLGAALAAAPLLRRRRRA